MFTPTSKNTRLIARSQSANSTTRQMRAQSCVQWKSHRSEEKEDEWLCVYGGYMCGTKLWTERYWSDSNCCCNKQNDSQRPKTWSSVNAQNKVNFPGKGRCE